MTPHRTNICQTPGGKIAQGVSLPGGKHLILCPDAFREPVHRTMPTSEQTIGTSLDTLASTGAVLLHEATHCRLRTVDIAGGYMVNGVLLTTYLDPSKAQQNADTWTYYAMASLANKNAWVVGLAQATNDFGPKAPKAPKASPSHGKRDVTPSSIRELRAIVDNTPTTFATLPRSPTLEARSLGPETVTVTITKDSPGTCAGPSTSGGSTGAVSTGKGSTGASPTGAGSTSGKSTGVDSTSTGSTGKGFTGAGPTGAGSTGAGSTGRSPASRSSSDQGPSTTIIVGTSGSLLFLLNSHTENLQPVFFLDVDNDHKSYCPWRKYCACCCRTRRAWVADSQRTRRLSCACLADPAFKRRRWRSATTASSTASSTTSTTASTTA